MLQITIPASPPSPPIELWDEANEEFILIPGKPARKEQKLRLEHSLVSVSKWESKWCKPFLSKDELTAEETIDYIKCMTLTQNVPPEVYDRITDDIVNEVADYIARPMTATTFSDKKPGKRNKEIVTNEVIYYWMFSQQIPMECEKWHLNRLLTLIRVFSVKNAPPKKMSKQELMKRNRALNEARRKQMNTTG